MAKKCPVCSSIVIGRSDKVFCSISCQKAQYYESAKKNNLLYNFIDRQIKINRKVLKHYNKAGKTSIRKEILVQKGFDPHYFTHYWKNSKGEVYLFCYDYGFLKHKEKYKEKYILIQWQNYMSPSN